MLDYEGPGLCGYKLQDGICIADRIVRAPIQDAIAVFGEPIQVVRHGEALVQEPPEGAVMFAEAMGEWTNLEPTDSIMMDDEGEDYLAPLFATGIAALEGRIPTDLRPTYENPLLTASEAARTLGVEAFALWGSDEHIGICGGALIDATGSIALAYADMTPDDIQRCAESRGRSVVAPLSDPEENDLDDLIEREEGASAYRYEPGQGVQEVNEDVMELLDEMLKERDATQPFDPITMWGMWAPEAEIWVAVRR